jgi:hypothetical protein
MEEDAAFNPVTEHVEVHVVRVDGPTKTARGEFEHASLLLRRVAGARGGEEFGETTRAEGDALDCRREFLGFGIQVRSAEGCFDVVGCGFNEVDEVWFVAAGDAERTVE